MGFHPYRQTPVGRAVADWAVADGNASKGWARTVQDFRGDPGASSHVSAHAEEATGRAYSGATSIEELLTKGSETSIRHGTIDGTGEVLHETYRPYGKFG